VSEQTFDPADLLVAALSGAIRRLPPDGELPEVPQGARFVLEVPEEGGTFNMAGVDLRPRGEEVLSLNFGNFAVFVTRDGVALVLSGGVIDLVKSGFTPEHSRIVQAWRDLEDEDAALERLKAMSQERLPAAEVLRVGRRAPETGGAS